MAERPLQGLLRPGHTPPLVLAHRGGGGRTRENTVAAFRHGLAAGADGVELDVRRSADGVLVVHHDPDVAGTAVDHLATGDLPSWLPTLDDALAACAGALVDVEVKAEAPAVASGEAAALGAQVAEALAPLLGAADAPAGLLLTSFWPVVVAAAAEHRPAVPRGLLLHPALEPRPLLDEARRLGCDAVLPHVSRLDEALVEEAHGAGQAVVVWTVNEPAALRGVLGAGADAVVTDDPVTALAVLRSA